MENKDKGKYLYVTIKAGYSPNVPEPLPKDHYSSLIKLAREAGATPVPETGEGVIAIDTSIHHPEGLLKEPIVRDSNVPQQSSLIRNPPRYIK